jgi:hypothetical protein
MFFKCLIKISSNSKYLCILSKDEEFESSAQYCCNGQVIPKRYTNTMQEFNETLTGLQVLYEPNQCYFNVTHELESKICDEFELIRNQTGMKYTDNTLLAYKPYDYKLCVRNSHAVTCSAEIYSRQTQPTKPFEFVNFNYKIECQDTVTLSWNYPLQLNGVLTNFKLYRDGVEISRSLNLTFTDINGVRPYEVYKYELEVCNQVGCVRNSKKLLVCTTSQMPELFGIHAVYKTHESIGISWRLPLKPFGILEKFVVEIKEICLELPIYFDFSSNSTSLNLSQSDLRMINQYSFMHMNFKFPSFNDLVFF